MRHFLQSIIRDSAVFTASSQFLLTSTLNTRNLKRNYTGTSYERTKSRYGRDSAGIDTRRISNASTGTSYERSQAGRDAVRSSNRGRFDGRDSELEGNRYEKKVHQVPPRLVQRKQWLDSRGIRPTSKKEAKAKLVDREIQQHLKYLNDPVKLADFVRNTLRTSDNFDFVLELVRTASKNALHVVSWNHLVGYLMSKGKMNAAISTYNEMKKRAQTPDAYTYTTLFTGAAEHKDFKVALPKVLNIYNSMFAENSKVKPNTIHMNCVMKMCSKAMDMDAMFAIASQFTEKGLKAPNNLSFTIILNALRLHAAGGPRTVLSPMEMRRHKREAIVQAREIWVEVIDRWRKGDIWIDEELVAAMGRVLLVGEEEDWDDIFSLVQQTMNIPRQIPKLGTPARQRIDPASQSRDRNDKEPKEHEAEIVPEDGNRVPHFENITVPVSKEDGIAMYAKPGPNILSLLLQASLELRLKAPATSYWNVLTKSLLIQPDKENYHAYLRVLRVARSGTETVQLLQEMPRDYMESKTFRISMSCCGRDKRNPNTFKNAGKILDLMQMSLRQPDIPALREYLDIAITAPAFDSTDSTTPSKQAQGKQILRALDRLNPSFINLKSALHFGVSSAKALSDHARKGMARDIMDLTKRMISAYDLLMDNALVARDTYIDLTKQRSKLAAFVSRYQNSRG
ncbi:pentatricopeptide repeat protein [Diplocarpon rosae]|nr:pentatricopeptide repeat protein [Diplocarpon rosae]